MKIIATDNFTEWFQYNIVCMVSMVSVRGRSKYQKKKEERKKEKKRKTDNHWRKKKNRERENGWIVKERKKESVYVQEWSEWTITKKRLYIYILKRGHRNIDQYR